MLLQVAYTTRKIAKPQKNLGWAPPVYSGQVSRLPRCVQELCPAELDNLSLGTSQSELRSPCRPSNARIFIIEAPRKWTHHLQQPPIHDAKKQGAIGYRLVTTCTLSPKPRSCGCLCSTHGWWLLCLRDCGCYARLLCRVL